MPRLGFLGIFAGAGRTARGDVSEASSTQCGRREGCASLNLSASPPPTPPLRPSVTYASTTTTITTASTNTTASCASSLVSSFGKGARAKDRRSPPRPCPLTVPPKGTYQRPRSLDQQDCWNEFEPASPNPPASSAPVDVPCGSFLTANVCVDTEVPNDPSSFERDSGGKGKRGSFRDTVLRLFEEKKSVGSDPRVVKVETSGGQRTRRYRRRRERRRAGLIVDSEDEMSDYGTYVRHRRQWVDHIRTQESTDTNTDGDSFTESLGGGGVGADGGGGDALYVRAHSASDILQNSFQSRPAAMQLSKKVVPVYYLDSVDALPEPDQLLGRLGHSLDSCVEVRNPPVGEAQSMCVVWDLGPDELGAGSHTPPSGELDFDEAEREHASLAHEVTEGGPINFSGLVETMGTESPFSAREQIEHNEPNESRDVGLLEPSAAESHQDPADSHPILQEIQQRFSKWNRRSPSYTLLTLPEDIPEDGEEEQHERKPSPYPRRCRAFRSVPCSPVVPLSPSYTCHSGRGGTGLQGKGRYYSDMENALVRSISHRRRSKLKLSLAPGDAALSAAADGREGGGKGERGTVGEDHRCQETITADYGPASILVPSPIYAEPVLPDAVPSPGAALPPLPPPRPFDYLQGGIPFTRSETSSPMLPPPPSPMLPPPPSPLFRSAGRGLQGNLFFGQDFQLGLQEWQQASQEEETHRPPLRLVERQLKQVELRVCKSNKQEQHPREHEYEVPFAPQRSNDRLRDSAYFSTDETTESSSQGSSGGNNNNTNSNSNSSYNNSSITKNNVINLGVASGKGPDLIREIIQKSIEENLTKLPEIIAAEINRQVLERLTTTTTSAVQSSESEETAESAIVTPQTAYAVEESCIFQPKDPGEVLEPRKASNKLGINQSMTNLHTVSSAKRPTTLALKSHRKVFSYSCQNLVDEICSPGLKPLLQQQHTALSFADLGLVDNEDALAPVDFWPLQLEPPQAPSASISVPCHLQDIALSDDMPCENPSPSMEEVQVEGDLSELPYKHHAPLKLALKPLCRDLSKSLKLRDEVENHPDGDDLSKKLCRRRKKKSLLLRLKVNLDQMEGDGSDGSMEWDYYDQTDGTWCEEF